MRKLKLQVQMSVDGYVARPDGALDWMTWVWDDGLKQFVDDIHKMVDCILLGRKMTDDFVTYWTKVAENVNDPEYRLARKMVDTPKVVFTKTLETSPWANTVLAKGDITEEVNKLKLQEGQDIIVYGGATFVGNLISAGLIDELNLFINPTAISEGMRIFNRQTGLELVETKSFSCGIAVLIYKPIKN